MPTTYTPILQLALPATGDLNGTWGTTVNDNITSMVEQAIAGLATINTWTAASHTLTTANGTTSEARCAILQCSGAPGAAATVICPTASKVYIIKNSVTGGYAVTLKTSAGTGVSVANGVTALLYCDGTNVVSGDFNGDVVGPSSATDNAIARFDLTTGKLIQNSLVTVADDGAITAPGVSSVIPFYYANQAAFPSASTYHGAVAHSHADGAMYFAHAGVWTRMLNDGGPLGTPSSGTVTNLTGTASINVNGTVGATTPSTGAFTNFTASGTASFTSTGAVVVSSGTTGQRPSPLTAMFRFNTTTTQFEGYNGTVWGSIGGGATITNDTTTASNIYPALLNATSGSATDFYTGNANLLYKPSTGELQSTVMISSNGITVNSSIIAANYTIGTNYNGMSAGPITINSGIVVTVSSGSTWVVL